tara:strand:- start:4133 stop:5911 length:1779 start_codon:yes stop_codon:yes gene_type:complete
MVELLLKQVTAEVELYRILRKKDNAKKLAENDLTLKEVQYAIRRTISKYIERNKDEINPKPQITWTSSQLKSSFKDRQRPEGWKVSSFEFIKSSLQNIMRYAEEKDKETILKVIDVFLQDTKTTKVERKMSLQEKTLNEVLIDLEEDQRITDKTKSDLKERKIITSKFLVGLNESVWNDKKKIHPAIVSKLVRVDSDGKRNVTDLYRKFERFLKSEFNRSITRADRLRRVAQRIEQKRVDKSTVPSLIKTLNADEYKFNKNSAIHLNKLVNNLNANTGADADFYDLIEDFIEDVDGDRNWSLDEIAASIRRDWDVKSESEKEGEDFQEYAGNYLVKLIKEIEKEYIKIMNTKSAIDKLEQIINENSDRRVAESVTNFEYLADLREHYEGLQNNIKDYKSKQGIALQEIQEDEERERLRRDATASPKTKEEKEWEQKRFAQIREEDKKQRAKLDPIQSFLAGGDTKPDTKEKLMMHLRTLKEETKNNSKKGAETNLQNVNAKIDKEFDRFKQSQDYRRLLKLINPGRGDPYYNKMTRERRAKLEKRMDDLIDNFKTQERIARLYKLQKQYRLEVLAFNRIPQIKQLLERMGGR